MFSNYQLIDYYNMQSNNKTPNSIICQIPNIFTLLNLFFGCIAIVFTLQNNLVLTTDADGNDAVILPEKIYLASIFIAIAAVIDFLDGFVARCLKVSSEMGKQLDSLADVVSFGVAPGIILYQFLRLSFSSNVNALDTAFWQLLPAFIFPCAGAYRLARFNIDTEQSYGFKGVPIPAAGILIASFPLIYWYSNKAWIISLFTNTWFLWGITFVVSYLMISTLPMMALKFKNPTLKSFLPFIILALIALITAFLIQ
ncbi:MAG: CDP-diacylglycerol--serine O-phosphatidyltransferase, partial [Chitinophagaceae bacterium]